MTSEDRAAPRTEAAQALLKERGSSDYRRTGEISMPWDEWETVLARIEREAAAAPAPEIDALAIVRSHDPM